MSVSETPLSVALLHNYRDEQQPSMRLYAERLGEALVRRDVRVTRVRPPGVVPAAWRAGSSGWNKVDGYVGRFAVYPRLVQNLHADVVHVVDHGQGYLVAGLDASRTVVTCHDVILLALAAGRIGSLRVPLVAHAALSHLARGDEECDGRRGGLDPDQARPGRLRPDRSRQGDGSSIRV